MEQIFDNKDSPGTKFTEKLTASFYSYTLQNEIISYQRLANSNIRSLNVALQMVTYLSLVLLFTKVL